MRRAKAFDRRKFLLLGGIGGVGGVLLGARDSTWLSSVWPDGEKSLHERLAALFPHQSSARVIGRTYLQQYPPENNVRDLLTGIVAGPANDRFSGRSDRLSTAADHELISTLQQQILQDYVEERVVKLQGWILSVTEARLCALTALA
jgi:hypothetical protein